MLWCVFVGVLGCWVLCVVCGVAVGGVGGGGCVVGVVCGWCLMCIGESCGGCGCCVSGVLNHLHFHGLGVLLCWWCVGVVVCCVVVGVVSWCDVVCCGALWGAVVGVGLVV